MRALPSRNLSFNALGVTNANALRYASRLGAEGVAQILVESLAAEVRRERALHVIEPDVLQSLADALVGGVSSAPAIGRALLQVLTLARVRAGAAPDISLAAVVAACDIVAERIRTNRGHLADLGAQMVGPNRTVHFFGVGLRHQVLAASVAARFGRVRFFVSGPERVGMADAETPAQLGANELRAYLRVAAGRSDLPRIETVRLPDAALAVAQADYLFLLATGVGLDGELVVPPGAELVYHTAIAKGVDVIVLLDDDDLLSMAGVAPQPDLYSVLPASPGIHYVSPLGALSAGELALLGRASIPVPVPALA